MVKKLILGIILLFVSSTIIGYFYFKVAFKAPTNLCSTRGNSTTLNIAWVENSFSKRGAMLVPISLAGIADSLWMQFDLGAVYSVLYNNTITSLGQHYPQLSKHLEKDFQLKLGEMNVTFDSIALLNYGKSINFKDQNQQIIIGTLGTAFLESTKALINFKDAKISFFNAVPDSLKSKAKIPFHFKERRVLIDVALKGESKTIMWDTGASAFNLITSESNFHKWRDANAEVEENNTNQQKRKLEVYTAPTAIHIEVGEKDIPVKYVTYVEGFPWYVKAMFKVSGMEGMVGNNLFKDNSIYLNCKGQELIIF